MGIIGTREIEQVYPIAKDVHEKITNLCADERMNRNSARFYIQAFLAMMDGRRYEKTINKEATIYFLEKIREDFGSKALKTALSSVKQHVDYYEASEGKLLPSIKKVYQEFLKRL